MSQFRVYVTKPRRKKDGRKWQLVAKPPAGSGAKRKRRSSKTTDRAEAEHRAREWERLLNGIAGPLSDAPTVIEILDRFLALVETDGATPEGTVTTFRTAFKRVRPHLAGVRAEQLDGPAVARVRDALLVAGPSGKPLDGKTVNVTLSRVRTAWRWALELGHVRAPWPSVRSAKARRTAKRPLRPPEVAAFLRWVASYQGGRWLPFFALAVDTGARSGDVLALEGRHVDRERRRVWVRDRKLKTERWAGVTARTMALVPEVAPDVPLFVGQRGRVTPNTVLAVFRRGVAAIGIEDHERVDVHSLRRTNAKEADRNGVSMGMAMKQQGHRSVPRHMGYQHDPDDDEDMSAVAEQIASRWGPLTGPLTDPAPGGGQPETPQSSQWFVTSPLGPNKTHVREQVAPRTPDLTVARRGAPSRAVAPAAGEGAILVDPHAATFQEISDMGERYRAALRSLASPWRLMSLLASLADGYPDDVPETAPAPAKKGGRRAAR